MAACEDLVYSTRLNADRPNSGVSGLVYSLPIGQVQIVAHRGPADISQALANLSAAQLALSKAEQPPAQNQNPGGGAAGGTPPSAGGGTSPPAVPGQSAAAAVADAITAAKTGVLAATAALQQVAKNVDGTWVPLLQETVALTSLPFAPDPEARYVADFQHRPWRDDNLSLTVNNGLLSSGTLTSTGQVPAIVQALATAGFTLGMGLPRPPNVALAYGYGYPAPTQVNPLSCQYSYTGFFDPMNTADVKRMNDELGVARSGNPVLPDRALQIQVAIPGTLGFDPSKPLPVEAPLDPGGGLIVAPPAPAAPRVPTPGLFYRLATAVAISANYTSAAVSTNSACTLNAIPAVTPVTVVVPDSRSGQEVLANAIGGLFTTNTIGLTFSNGILTVNSVNQPSELLAIAGIPASLVNLYTSIITNIVQLRVNIASAQQTVAQAQLAVVQAQLAQAEAQVQLAMASSIGNATAQQALLTLQTEIQTLQKQLNQPAS